MLKNSSTKSIKRTLFRYLVNIYKLRIKLLILSIMKKIINSDINLEIDKIEQLMKSVSNLD